jgi:serine/threonine-protein kinase
VAKLTDLGLRARRTTRTLPPAKRQSVRHALLLPPEQIRGEVDIDFRADIYSLGATMYHMVTASHPSTATRPAP